MVEEICNGERISWLILICMAGVRYVAKKLARAFNPISFSGVRYVDVVTCLVLVLFVLLFEGGLTSMWRLHSS